MVNCSSFDLHFSGAEIALEVGHIIIGVPEAELDKGEESDGLGGNALVLEAQPAPPSPVKPRGTKKSCSTSSPPRLPVIVV